MRDLHVFTLWKADTYRWSGIQRQLDSNDRFTPVVTLGNLDRASAAPSPQWIRASPLPKKHTS